MINRRGLIWLRVLAGFMAALVLAPWQDNRPLIAQPAQSVANMARAESLQSETMVEDFEGPSPLDHWYTGQPAAVSAALTLSSGHNGRGARFAYDFSAAQPADAYAWANTPVNPPAAAEAVAFWVKSAPGVIIKLQVEDDTGQRLQYPLVRPFGSTDPDGWYRQVVKLDPAAEYWGGASDGVVHGALHSLTIVVGELWNAKAPGSMSFDELVLFDRLELSLNVLSYRLTPAPPGSARLSERLAVNIHFPAPPLWQQDARALDAAKAAGLTMIRHDLGWAAVETRSGVFDFTPYDSLVSMLEARGMRALFIVDQGNPLYTGHWTTPATTPAAIQAFGRFVEAAARHYAGRPVMFEVWNEPNVPTFWPPQPNAGQYASLLTEAVQHIHLGNPAAQVSTGGLSQFDYPFMRSYLGVGAAAGADAIGIHPYIWPPRPELVSDGLFMMRSLVAQALPARPPVWMTEWGVSSASFGDGHAAAARARQAIVTARELLSCWAMGFPVVVYYDIRDDGTDAHDAEHNFGLLANNYTEKPAYKAVRTLSAAADGRELIGFLDVQPSSVHALWLSGQRDVCIILWSDAANGAVPVSVPATTTATDYLGSPLTLTPAHGSLTFTLRESDGPVYLLFPAPARTFMPLVVK